MGKAVILKKNYGFSVEVEVYLCCQKEVMKKINELYIKELIKGRKYDEENTFLNSDKHYAQVCYDENTSVVITEANVVK